ncbi:gamma-glutamylcyclotransferase family protein [Streptomyces sp. GC420]|uniref:gamma-glutamylcyclotransferase family protein n=1 Tax=Streptomyces sp. GC420 TaxID=2697568 RepID=UPI0014151198|nr:gamma-glutamylcyclotransferase family protein [Streptomyces sp. GC420]NBM18640.1 gamma-glutamylcyclotransferase [Streptomyces sp. GC420]
MTAGTTAGAAAGADPRLPFFVYGTLRPGECNHDLLLRGRTVLEEPARLPGALLFDGPGYPYAVEASGAGPVLGEIVHPAPGHYAALLASLDHLEEYAPDDPSSLYLRVARHVVRPDGVRVRAWVYLAADRVARELRAVGRPIPGGDWRAARLRDG